MGGEEGLDRGTDLFFLTHDAQKNQNNAAKGTVKLARKSKVLRTNRHFPIQQAHVTYCHVLNDRFLNNR